MALLVASCGADPSVTATPSDTETATVLGSEPQNAGTNTAVDDTAVDGTAVDGTAVDEETDGDDQNAAFVGWEQGRWQGANLYQRRSGPLDSQANRDRGATLPYYDLADFEALAELGANLVVISHPGVFTERPPYVLDEPIVENLDRLIGLAHDSGLSAVVAMRTGPGRSEATFFDSPANAGLESADLGASVWSDPSAQDGWVDMWAYLATRYGDTEDVIGFDLMVEPNEGLGQESKVAVLVEPPAPGADSAWDQLQARLAATIRAIDPNTPILVEPEGWGSPTLISELPAPEVAGVVFVVHNYAPFEYSVGTQSSEKGEQLPSGADAAATFATILAKAVADASVVEVPVAVLEFGVNQDRGDGLVYLNQALAAIEGSGTSSAVWLWQPDNDPSWARDPLGFSRSDISVDARLDALSSHWVSNS